MIMRYVWYLAGVANMALHEIVYSQYGVSLPYYLTMALGILILILLRAKDNG
jgi:hypothetical protein